MIENFISIIIWIIIIVTVVRKVRGLSQKKDDSTPKAPKGKIMKGLQDLFTQIQVEMEKAREAERQRAADSSTWNALREDAPQPEAVAVEDASPPLIKTYKPKKKMKTSHTPDRRQEMRKAREDMMGPDTDALAAHEERMPVTPMMGKIRKGRPKYALGTRDLKRAIIWSEIIGPPKAMRDENCS